jgi:hypothetical protein
MQDTAIGVEASRQESPDAVIESSDRGDDPVARRNIGNHTQP